MATCRLPGVGTCMARRTPRRLATPMAGALLVLATLAPGSARAGCYKPHATASHFELLVRVGAMAEPIGPGSEATPPGRPPTCSGPLCSRGPAAPPVTSWTAPGVPESWACLVERLRPDAASPSPLPRDAAPRRPADRALSIFHPPRCLAT